ncbi:transposase [Anaerovoracaceae bacterium 42-11]
MNTRLLTQEERFELVMECRSSGLSDYQWCQEKGINPGTFYNWIARFRKKGYPNIPEPTGRTSKSKAVKQDVVRLDVLPDTPENAARFCTDGFSRSYAPQNCETAMEICTGNAVIRISNNIDPQLFCMVLSQLGGSR